MLAHLVLKGFRVLVSLTDLCLARGKGCSALDAQAARRGVYFRHFFKERTFVFERGVLVTSRAKKRGRESGRMWMRACVYGYNPLCVQQLLHWILSLNTENPHERELEIPSTQTERGNRSFQTEQEGASLLHTYVPAKGAYVRQTPYRLGTDGTIRSRNDTDML